MKILHLTQDFAAGGAQRQLSYLAPELASFGHHVTVGYLRGGPNLNRCRADGVVLVPLGTAELGVGRQIGNYDPRLLARLAALIRRSSPDVVQTWIGQMDVLGGAVCSFMGRHWLLREPASAKFYVNTWKNRLRQVMGGRASMIVANSSEGISYWDPCTRPLKRVIRNAVPVEAIDRAQRASLSSLGLAESDKLVLYVGRMAPAKNIRDVVTCLVKVLGSDPRARFVLCGDGPETDRVRQQIESSSHPERFSWFSFRPDVWSLMKAADVLISSSSVEGCPNVVLEAMACGTPLVVSDIPEHREILNAETALFSPPNDPDSAAECVLRTLADSGGARLRAEKASASTRALSISSMARQYEQAYMEIGTSRLLTPRRRNQWTF